MLPILRPCTRSIPAFGRYLYRSAGTLSSPELNDNISKGADGNASFVPVLEQCKQQGNRLNPSDFRSIIETLRDSERFPQALKVSEWMSESKVCDLIPEDFVARLNLIDNVLGLEEAEKFFEKIPENKRDHSVYTTILRLYTRSEETLDKAESIFRKMKVLGHLSKLCPFNHMMTLYNQLNKRDIVYQVLSQMEKNNVEADKRTLNIKMRLLVDCEADKHTSGLDWRMNCEMAKNYMEQGLVFEALKMMRRVEASAIEPKTKKLAYESLMKLYADARKAEEVYRIWELYKREGWMSENEGYVSLVTSLLKLNHFRKAEEIVNVWLKTFGTGC